MEQNKNRINAVYSFIKDLKRDFESLISIAVCGSLAIENAKENSDIDLLIIIDQDNLKSLLNSSVINRVFEPIINDEVIDKFSYQFYNLYRPKDSQYKDFLLSVNILSVSYCIRLCNLENFDISKFRFSERNSKIFYRGFDNVNGQNQMPYEITVIKNREGVQTLTPSYLSVGLDTYFHINIDKFFTAQLVLDELDISICQDVLRSKLYSIWKQTNYSDFLGFLEKRNELKPVHQTRLMPKIKSEISFLGITQLKKYERKIILVAGGSGVGKDTLIKNCIMENDRFKYHIPTTTRIPREGENNNIYNFVNIDTFFKYVENGDFVFWHYNGQDNLGNKKFYGVTHKSLLFDLSISDAVFINVGGILSVKEFKRYFPSCITILITTDNEEQRKKQLISRGTEALEEIQNRFKNKLALNNEELNLFDFIITNSYNKIRESFIEFNNFIIHQIYEK